MNVTLNQRLQAEESAHLEFKKDASDLAAVGAALCAFLNGKGGSILVGVSETGQICPLEDATAQARRIEEFSACAHRALRTLVGERRDCTYR